MSRITSEMHTMPTNGVNYSVDTTISSDTAEARPIQEAIENRLRSQLFSDKDIFCIKLALEEAIVNAIKHGNQMDRNKKVRIAYSISAERFDALIADEGPGFDPDDVPDPTAVENLERPCGRGVMLMRHYMTQVSFYERGNVVAMHKVRNGKH